MVCTVGLPGNGMLNRSSVLLNSTHSSWAMEEWGSRSSSSAARTSGIRRMMFLLLAAAAASAPAWRVTARGTWLVAANCDRGHAVRVDVVVAHAAALFVRE